MDTSAKVVIGTVCVTSYTENVPYHCRDPSAKMINGESTIEN